MKGYFIVHPYLSDIQKGIQTAHCLRDMTLQFSIGDQYSSLFVNWAKNVRTIAVLRSGFSTPVSDYLIVAGLAGLPCGQFREPNLNNICTCVGFIGDYNFVAAVEDLRNNAKSQQRHGLSSSELELARHVAKMKLA